MSEDKMPQNVREVFQKVFDEFSWVSRCWNLYQGLYCNTAEQYQMLGSISADFFSTILYLIQREIITGLCRICDKANHGGNHNICLESLKHEINNNNDNNLTVLITEPLSRIIYEIKPLVTYRNKRAAHKDKIDALYGNLREIYGVTNNVVENIRKTVLLILQIVEDYYNPNHLINDITSRDTADKIVSVLKRVVSDNS